MTEPQNELGRQLEGIDPDKRAMFQQGWVDADRGVIDRPRNPCSLQDYLAGHKACLAFKGQERDQEIGKRCDEIEEGLGKDLPEDRATWTDEHCLIYRSREQAELLDLLRATLETDHGITGVSKEKLDLLFSEANRMVADYAEVAVNYRRLVPLVK